MIGLPFAFDFKKPDYVEVWNWRVKLLTVIRQNADTLDALYAYYGEHPIEFIIHWGSTFDPRNADIGLPTVFPFILFERQIEWCEWTLDHWRTRENGVSPKSRDMGLSWLSICLSCTVANFKREISIGFGSRKEEYVDKIGDPKSIFWKGRFFMDKLPREFKRGWDIKQHAPYMRLFFPETNSTITGEAGDNIGRGDRKSIYFVDEAAHLMHPELTDAALSATTNCRIDLSSVNGPANPFASKVRTWKVNNVFTFHWRDDPRKDDAWYARESEKINDPRIVAQEIDIDFTASIDGVVIPSAWVQASINAASILGIEVTGSIEAAVDVADEGRDINAACIKRGIEILGAEGWSGKDSDTFHTTRRVFDLADLFDCSDWLYDADGIGAFVRGDSKVINEQRAAIKQSFITFRPFRGSGAVIDPEKEVPAFKGRKNKDYFLNRKAQAWWNLRFKFQTTFRAISAFRAGTVYEYDPDDIISIPDSLANLGQVQLELSQATYDMNAAGKLIINKTPDGARSPNYADAIMMAYSPRRFSLFS